MIPTKYGFHLSANPKSYFAKCLQENGGTYEEPESQLVLSIVRPGDFCIDAGAYVGYYASLMIKAGAKVLAVEPNPNNWPFLQSNVFNPELGRNPLVDFFANHGQLPCNLIWDFREQDRSIQDYALSDVGTSNFGPEQMHVFYMPSEYDDGWGSMCAADPAADGKAIKVWRIRLDALLAGLHYPAGPIRFLKMDVEGVEVPALRGLGARLADVDYILVECIDIASRVSVFGSTVAGINELLAGWQVKRHQNGQWNPVEKSFSNGENFLFINPRLIS